MIKKTAYLIPILSLIILWTSCKKEETPPITQQVTKPTEPMFDSITGLNKTGTEMLDFRDNNSYNVVYIGQKYWLAQNLRYNVTNSRVYPNKSVQKHGRLYPWDALMNNDTLSSTPPSITQGICPKGWHIPSIGECKNLIDTISMNGMLNNNAIIKAIKSTSGWYSYLDYDGNTIYTDGTNSSGFNLYPAGYATPSYPNNYNYSGFSSVSTFWLASEPSDSLGHQFELINSTFMYHSQAKDKAYSCRCVLD